MNAPFGKPDTAFDLGQVVSTACSRIAPVWPLRHFVAINPFLGFADSRFEAACGRIKRDTGADTLMPRAFYRDALASGRIADEDLLAALAFARPRARASSLTALKDEIARERKCRPANVSTVAEVWDEIEGAEVAPFVRSEIAKWCAAYWDEGQAVWRMPSRNLGLYQAWRAVAAVDRTPEVMGLTGFRHVLADLPVESGKTTAFVVAGLGIPEGAIEPYLHRALAGVGGWAGHARYLAWSAALCGQNDQAPEEVLAVRLAWDWAIYALGRARPAFKAAWEATKAVMSIGDRRADEESLACDCVLQDAYERAFQRELVAQLAARRRATKSPSPLRPLVQAAFCIDVRSEVYRRALESIDPQIETLGFAGFFGFAIEYIEIGDQRGAAQCPVLLTPQFVVREGVAGATEAEEAKVLDLRILRRRLANAWKAFKISAVSCFPYVETLGLLFGLKLIGDAAGLTRTVAHSKGEGLDAAVRERLAPRLDHEIVGGRDTGFTRDQRVDMASAVLGAMSLTSGFARLVMLAGHGSTTVNNPFGSGLDCGACGGHTGEANARVAAGILNDPVVRSELARRGLALPTDTWFVAALHDTTTDEVTLFDLAAAPTSHKNDIERLRQWLARASRLARAERAGVLGIRSSERVDAGIARRARDWSQVRPEWGLAGNAAFIAAPRSRTRGLDLRGRVFLHEYVWERDLDFSVLELIMTAPMVVASWINLQYYGSTVDNRSFGAGNKVLHNVVGTLGVIEGNGGDLRVGLPWQAVHDGRRLVHEPLRLSVFLEAPLTAIDRVLDQHAGVRDLVDNGWVHLFAITDGTVVSRYAGERTWIEELVR